MTKNNFIALEILDLPDRFSWHFLTPRLMQWRAGVFIMDLSATQGYWRICAERRNLKTIDFLREILEKNLGDSAKRFRAVLSKHPWRALLLLNQMKERRLYGFMFLESPLGQSLYQALTWESWFLAAEEIAEHLEAAKFPRFNPQIHQKNLRLLKSSTKRLRLNRPWELSQARADALAVKRRFGNALALLWDFSYGEEGPESFPWTAWHPEVKPTVKRHLDFAIWNWDSLEPFLREDFDRLCSLDSWTSKEKTLKLLWSLTDDGLTISDVWIRFRNPHSFHKEMGHHKTALLQSNYAFSAFKRKLDLASRASDLEPSPIVSWQLTIEEKILPPPILRELFQDLDSVHFNDEILDIENQIPIELSSFRLAEDWLPEDSFQGVDDPVSLGEEELTPWLRLARRRPLFLYDVPVTFDAQEISGRIFLERVSGKWWETEKDGASQRDYYQLSDRNNQVRWVYRDESGSWYLHGIYH